LGTKYRKPILAALVALKEGTLQDLIPDELKAKVKIAFAFTDDVPDAAYIIIGTGRRPVKSEKGGWSEGGESLLKVDPLPDNFESFDQKMIEKIMKTANRQDKQQECCQELMTLFFNNAPEDPPKVEKVKVAKKATVVKLHKEPKVIPENVVVVDEALIEAVEAAVSPDEPPHQEPVPEPVKPVKPKTPRTKKTTK